MERVLSISKMRKLPSNLRHKLASDSPLPTTSNPEPYIFANPWPFKNEFTHRPLPAYARWYTESWEGALVPITALYDTKIVYDTLSNFFSAVIQASASTLSE